MKERIKKTGNTDATSTEATSVRISTATKLRVDKKADELDISTKEYVESACKYFLRYGLNPTSELTQEDVTKELFKFREQLFAFLRKQEFEEVAPTYRIVQQVDEKLVSTNNSLVNLLESIAGLPFMIYKIHLLQELMIEVIYKLNDAEDDYVKALAAQVNAAYQAGIKEFHDSRGGGVI